MSTATTEAERTRVGSRPTMMSATGCGMPRQSCAASERILAERLPKARSSVRSDEDALDTALSKSRSGAALGGSRVALEPSEMPICVVRWARPKPRERLDARREERERPDVALDTAPRERPDVEPPPPPTVPKAAAATEAGGGTSEAGTPAAAAKRSASAAKGGKGEAEALAKGRPAGTVMGASTTVSAAERRADRAAASSSWGGGEARERARHAGTSTPERSAVCAAKGRCQ